MLRMVILWALVLPVVHWLVATYARSVRREALEREFDNGGESGTREDFVERGLAAYQTSLRARLLVLVYVLPILALLAIAWAVNAN